jgi:uncharacterized protein YdeI (YjbR/CyaY-like superfamily)
MDDTYKIVEFKTSSSFRDWLHTHHSDTNGVWIRLYKKASNIQSVTYAEALDEALCFGWIDGQRKSYDELSFLQMFTPRRSKSLWSKRNIEHTERLIETKRMMSAGMGEIQRAQADGRWAAAYDAPSTMQVPTAFLAELKKHPKAEQFFETLNKTNRYAIAWRLQTAKTDDTYRRRQAKLIAMLEAGEKIP